jgi:hypothetical protein
MPFSSFTGDLPAHDLFGSFIAHRIGTENSGMVCEGKYISILNEQGDEIFQVPLASTTA